MSTPEHSAALVSTELVGSFPSGAHAAPAGSPRYVSMPAWLAGHQSRYWEAAETTRLNEAHWLLAADESINVWLAAQLPTIRGRLCYEAKNNPTFLGMIATHAADIVGPDGPELQVQSDDDDYNEALERVWQDWFYAPTHRDNISGAAMLKLWVKSLHKTGAILAQLFTDRFAEGPVRMRLRPMSPRRLGTPAELAGNPRVFMGVEYDADARPLRYWIQRQIGLGTSYTLAQYDPIPAELIVHEYLWEEEDQGAGIPWLSPSLQPAADLRDYDDQVQDAARQMADQSALLYNTRPDATLFEVPEQTTVQRRTIKMAPPGWQPFVYPATQPPVQYPDYRGERHTDIGRPIGMPRLLVRADASKHSWASARMDIQPYARAVSCLQNWLSGSERSTGVLNRLVREVEREARFSVPELRRRPPTVRLHWTWPELPPIEPDKQARADATSLANRTRTLTEILAGRKKTLESHVEEIRREEAAFADLVKPSWMQEGAATPSAGAGRPKSPEEIEEEAADAK